LAKIIPLPLDSCGMGTTLVFLAEPLEAITEQLARANPFGSR
jgi:hypothetical protein